MRDRTIQTAILMLAAVLQVVGPASGFAQDEIDLEEFVVAAGPPAFDEQPLIQGKLVAWRRYGGHIDNAKPGPDGAVRYWRPARIECRDITRGDTPVVPVAEYPAGYAGVYLSPTHLFWGTETVYARRLEDLAAGEDPGGNIVVGHGLAVRAASKEYVFLGGAVEKVGPSWYKGKYFAKPIAELSDAAPEAIGVVANVSRLPLMTRDAAASEKYFVWCDRDPEAGEETWKVYAKRMDDIFTPGAEFVALDTGSRYPLGVYLAIHGGTLVVQGAYDPANDLWGKIYLLDIDRGGEPIELADAGEHGVYLECPAVSAYYAVWQETRDYTKRQAYGIRLEDGLPVGDVFPIGGPGSGSWITIDRNIAVWNDVVAFGPGADLLGAIVAAELPLPGATDLGDVDQNGKLNLTDGVLILNYLFLGGWQPRRRLADVDRNGKIQLNDALRILRHLFGGSPLSD